MPSPAAPPPVTSATLPSSPQPSGMSIAASLSSAASTVHSPTMRFQGRIALVTAGGRGIGRATAEIIGRESGTVVLVDNDKAALDEAAGAIRPSDATFDPTVAVALDAGKAGSVVRPGLQPHRRIDILVNAVGGSTITGSPAAPIDELAFEAWKRLLHFNLPGPFL